MGPATEAVALHLSGLYQRLRGRRPEELVVDPVCYLQVDPQSAESRRHGSEEFFFCSSHCARRFETDPERFLGRREGRA